MRLDFSAVGGIIFGVIALVGGFVLEGGRAGALLEGTAAMIVFGGTIGATAVSFSLDDLKKFPCCFVSDLPAINLIRSN